MLTVETLQSVSKRFHFLQCGFRDVRTTDPETEIERPPASPALIKKSLPVSPKSYTTITNFFDCDFEITIID